MPQLNTATLSRISRISTSYWLALVAATISYAIVIENLLLPGLIALAGFILHLLGHFNSTDTAPRNRHRQTVLVAVQVAIIFVSYFSVLQSLWPQPLTHYYGLPLGVALIVSLLAAANLQSHGGSRAFASIAAIAFLLLIRNTLLYHDFEAPFLDFSQAAAFAAFIEITFSPRFTDPKDKPHPELLFGLLLAIIASFSISSLPLALGLTLFPLISFLLRNHKLSESPNEHTIPAYASSPRLAANPYRTLQYALLIVLPLVFTGGLYLSYLRIPFWTDFLPEDPPNLIEVVSNRAKLVSDAAALDNNTVQKLSDSIAENAKQIRSNAGKAIAAFTQNSKPIYDSQESGDLAPFSINPQPTEIRKIEDRSEEKHKPEPPPVRTHVPNYSIHSDDGIETGSRPFNRAKGSNIDSISEPSPPRAILSSPGTNTSLENLSLRLGDTDRVQPQVPTSSDIDSGIELTKNASTSNTEFDKLLADFDIPERAIAKTLDLEGSDLTTILDQTPLLVATLDSSQAAPRRLYLRRNILDTVSSDLSLSEDTENLGVNVDTSGDRIVATDEFRTSKSMGTTLTITAALARSPMLPLPESFGSIQTFSTDTITLYPDSQLAMAPSKSGLITYRLFSADLEVTDREKKLSQSEDSYLRNMLEVPLSKSDRKYLKNLASRIGGNKTPTRRFAYRFANYFSRRHRYSYIVDIPAGQEHPAVRWLKNECPGLCTNFAAAFTLLARTRGIPTRVVGGFVSEEYDSSAKRYILRQNNAHAWVEYLDESNRWIRFDPTPEISEAEIRRVEDQITPAYPDSLSRLLNTEQRNLHPRPLTPHSAPSSVSDSLIKSATEPLPESVKTDPDQPMPAADLLPQEKPHKNATTSSPSKLSSQTIAPTTKDEHVPAKPASPREEFSNTALKKLSYDAGNPIHEIEPLPSLKTEDFNSPRQKSDSPSERTVPWLLTLIVLAFTVPTLAFLSQSGSPKSRTPQTRERQKAGKLLNQLESLIKKHRLESDPIWNETRAILYAQRYGREANTLLLSDIAIKVSLLAKKKA